MTLEQQAEVLYPIKPKDCARVRMRILWLRERWIKEQKAVQ